MQEQETELERLEQEIKNYQELGDFYEKSFFKNKKLEDEIRLYFSRMKQHSGLLAKTKIKLNGLLSKINSKDQIFLDLCLSKLSENNGDIMKLVKEIEGYSKETENYRKKYDNIFKQKEGIPRYDPRKK